MKSGLFLLFLLLVFTFSTPAFVGNVEASPTTLTVSAAASKIRMGQQLEVSVNLDSASSLYGYEIWLSFDSSVLGAISVNYAGYLNEPTYIWNQQINNTVGYAALAVSSHWPAGSKTGGSPPPLATFYFKGNGLGTSPLLLSKTILVDDQAMKIAHQTLNSTVEVELGLGHDVAITGVVSAKSFVCQGYSAPFKVSVQNQGMFTETFNVALDANDTAVDNQTVTLTSGNSTDVTLSWNTTGFARGNYTVSAYAAPVPGETDTENNFTSPIMFTVRIQGDVVSPYGIVDMKDVAYLAKRFSTDHSSALWDPNADIDGSGRVDMKDIAVVARNFGAHA